MVTEHDKTLKAIRTAIQMETDGKQFYLKAGQKSSNEAGKKLLAQLAAEEDIHRQKFEEIYEAIRNQKGWPEMDFQPDRGKELPTIFAEATEEIGADLKALATELDDVQTAMAMENKTYDFYKARSKDADYDAERGFYEALAAQERKHHLVLLDYYEYLKNPAEWFVTKEHPSLDGG